MPPTQPASALAFDNWMNQDQYTSVQDLHSELQSSLYDVALGAGRQKCTHAYQQFARPSILSVAHTLSQCPSPYIWAVNNAPSSTAGVNGLFQYGEFSTFTNVNDQFNPNVDEPSQALFDLPLSYALPETDLLTPSTGTEQSGDAFFPIHNVYNQSSTPLLSQSTSVGMAIDAPAEVSTAPPRPSFMSERSNESPPNLHDPIQTPELNTCQECTQSFPSAAELACHAKSLPLSARAAKPSLVLTTLSDTGNKPPSSHAPTATGTQAPTHLSAKIISPNIFEHGIVSTIRETTKMTPTATMGRNSSALGPTVLNNNVLLGLKASSQFICVAFTTTPHFRALFKAV
ncbi:hypothetical protein MMC31_008079 [Peltigera leucophlebia]|nr:hypothetical protein [Peltigera leucophlebia]